MTPEEFERRLNNLSSEDVAKAMESMPADALAWGVKFEALAHRRQIVTISETLTIELDEVEEDFPGQADDYRLQKFREGLLRFIWHFADTHCKSPGESELLTLVLAKELFEEVHAAVVAEVLRERLPRGQR